MVLLPWATLCRWVVLARAFFVYAVRGCCIGGACRRKFRAIWYMLLQETTVDSVVAIVHARVVSGG